MTGEHSVIPRLTRRDLLRIGAVTLNAGFLQPFARPFQMQAAANVTPRGSADCVIYLNLVGGPSQMDTFDVKESKTTPQDLDIRTAKTGIRWPYGLLPR